MTNSKQPEPTQGLKILFADDEEAIQNLMAMEIPRMGHTVTVCPDGESAVRQANEETYDCLLVDLDMPGMHGTEVIRRIKEISPETEAVVLTGKQSLDTAVLAMRYGAPRLSNQTLQARRLAKTTRRAPQSSGNRSKVPCLPPTERAETEFTAVDR